MGKRPVWISIILALATANPAAAQSRSLAQLVQDATQQSALNRGRGIMAHSSFAVPLGNNAGRSTLRISAGPALMTYTSSRPALQREVGLVSLSVDGSFKPSLRLAGFDLRSDSHRSPGAQRQGVSTAGWVAIGVGTVLVVAATAFAICLSDTDCNGSD